MAETSKIKAFIPWLIIFGLWAVLHGALAVTVAAPVFDGVLPGPDEYMRLVRVAELRDGGGWYDSVIARGNAPYGDTLHWTRPMDMLILGVAALLSPFMTSADALFASGAAVSPILGLITCIAIAWAAFPLLGRDRSILAVFVFLIQPGILAYSAAGRADHHALLFLLFALVVGATIRNLAPHPSIRFALFTGVTYGLAIWTSVEMVLLVAICQAVAAFTWIRFENARARAHLLAACSFVLTTVIALLIERPLTEFFTAEFDRLSIPFLAIAVLTCAVWATAAMLEDRSFRKVGHVRYRLPVIGGAGCAALVVLLALFPDFISGPFAAVDPRVLPIWHAHVAELAPLVPDTLDHAGQFFFFIGGVAICLPYAVFLGWRNRSDPRGFRWIFLAAVIAVYFLLSLQHVRVAPFAELASVPVLADMIARLVDWSERRLDMLRRVLVTCTASFVLMFGGVLAGSYLLSLSAKASVGDPKPVCKISAIAPLLNDPATLGGKPLVIAGLLDHGPEILYRTQHSVIGAPYHRNGLGIWDSHRLFAATDETESRAIVSRRGVGLLLICPTGAERLFFNYERGSKNLYSRLLDGDIPKWLAPVGIKPDSTSDFQVFRVTR